MMLWAVLVETEDGMRGEAAFTEQRQAMRYATDRTDADHHYAIWEVNIDEYVAEMDGPVYYWCEWWNGGESQRLLLGEERALRIGKKPVLSSWGDVTNVQIGLSWNLSTRRRLQQEGLLLSAMVRAMTKREASETMHRIAAELKAQGKWSATEDMLLGNPRKITV